jgi:hypothetical protein
VHAVQHARSCRPRVVTPPKKTGVRSRLESDLFVEPGEWRINQLWLQFQHLLQDGSICTSLLGLQERNPITYVWNLPVMHVEAGKTAVQDLSYPTGQVMARLRVATGAPLSSPRVTGTYLQNRSGVRDRTASLDASSNAQNVLEGLVILDAIPGKYRLSATAYVAGSQTTFGQPFEVNVGPWDEITCDPGAPTVDVVLPEGGFETTGSCVTVSGTISDPDPIVSLTINGTAAAIHEGGAFSEEVCGLVPGVNIIQLHACDNCGDCVNLNRRVVVVNQPPVGADDAYEVAEDGVLSVGAPGVLGNDTDPDGNPLEAVFVENPLHGGVSLNPDGSFTYTPEPNWAGSDSLIYKASDKSLQSEPVTVSITVLPVNDPPVAVPLWVTTDEGTPVEVVPSGTDIEGDPLAFEVVEAPVHGTVTANEGRTFTYAPDVDWSGTDTFTYRASDGVDVSGTVTVEITVLPVNDPPVLGPIAGPVEPLPMGTALDVSATFTDPDAGDTHAAVWAWGDGTSGDGTVDEMGGLASGSHSYAGAGVYTVTLTITDADGLSDQASSQYLVIFDPTGSFVTGGGWIESPPGAYILQPSLTGRPLRLRFSVPEGGDRAERKDRVPLSDGRPRLHEHGLPVAGRRRGARQVQGHRDDRGPRR